MRYELDTGRIAACLELAVGAFQNIQQELDVMEVEFAPSIRVFVHCGVTKEILNTNTLQFGGLPELQCIEESRIDCALAHVLELANNELEIKRSLTLVSGIEPKGIGKKLAKKLNEIFFTENNYDVFIDDNRDIIFDPGFIVATSSNQYVVKKYEELCPHVLCYEDPSGFAQTYFDLTSPKWH